MWNNNQKETCSFHKITKQVFDPVQVPIIHFGNEIVVLNQQDVRTTIEERYLIYDKIPIPPDSVIKIYDDFTKLQQYGINQQNSQLPQSELLPFGNFQMAGAISPETTVVTPTPLQTQLDWEMTCPVNEISTNLNYKTVTFSNDLEQYYNRKRKHINLNRNRKKLRTYISRGCNTCLENVEYKNCDDYDNNNDSDTETVPTAHEQIKAAKILKSSILWNNF